jgi:hypothetical protein
LPASAAATAETPADDATDAETTIDDPTEAERLDILRALERGDIDVTEAGLRLEGLEVVDEDRTDA